MSECEAKHTPCPESYTAYMEWAATMSKTHRQTKCKTCGKWAVWVPRLRRAAAAMAKGVEL